MKIIFDYNRTLFDPARNILYFGAAALLSDLSQRHELFLVSRNEPERRRRFEYFKIAPYFREVLFVPAKSPALFTGLVGDEDLVLVVGDSLADEIAIGNQLGLVTVRVKQGKFSGDQAQSRDEIADYEINSLNELKDIIKIYE